MSDLFIGGFPETVNSVAMSYFKKITTTTTKSGLFQWTEMSTQPVPFGWKNGSEVTHITFKIKLQDCGLSVDICG